MEKLLRGNWCQEDLIAEIERLEGMIAGANSRLRTVASIAKTMRTTATKLKGGKEYAHPELQSDRNASAHSMEFWALRIEEELTRLV